MGVGPFKQFAVARNNEQQVIKVMGHTAGQLADGFHFLSLPQLCFQLFLGRNVTRVDHDQAFAGFVGRNSVADGLQHQPTAVAVTETVFNRSPRGRVGPGALVGGPGAGEILRMNELERAPVKEVCRRVTQYALRRRALVPDNALAIKDGDEIGSVFDQCAEALLAPLQFEPGKSECGEVELRVDARPQFMPAKRPERVIVGPCFEPFNNIFLVAITGQHYQVGRNKTRQLTDPAADLEGRFKASYERFGQVRSSAYLNVPISAGVAVHGKHGSTPQELIAAAEQALLAAKRLGRDRTVIFSDEVASNLLELGLSANNELPTSLETILSLQPSAFVYLVG